jgi:hypothetical protein
MQYLLVVRFYGYDDKGIPVTSDNSTYERAFPITFTGMSFKLDNKMAIYDIKANLINMQIGYDKLRGYMPDSTTISGDTVQSALDALADSLNKKQEAISSPTDATKKQSYPDVYKFMFASNTDIGNSVIVDKSHFVASSTPMPDVLNTLNINVRLSESGKADVVQKQKKEFSFPSMLPMASAVDQIITQSDFLIKALKVVDVETTQKESDAKPDYVTNAKPDPLVWYSMTPKIRVLQSDPKRNDFAYEITYYITEYKVPYVRSTGVTSTSSYEGPFKIYDYWYTGKNTEVLEYSQNFNLLYFVTGAASSAAADANQSDPTRTKQMTSSGASSTGMLSGSKEVMNTVRTALYSPGDTATATIKIIGDPDFLITAAGVPAAFMDQAKNDYSLDPSSGQAYIEIGIKQATDYNNSTGMLNYINQGTGQIDPNNNVNFWDYTDDIKKRTDRVIYMVILLKSHFSKGVFTQELKTILPPFTANTDTSTTTDQRNTDPPAPSTNYGGGRGSRGGATAEELKNAKSINPPIIQITKTWNTPNPDDDNTVFFTQPNKQKSLVQLPGGINLNRGK